jgi:hypothetical protein
MEKVLVLETVSSVTAKDGISETIFEYIDDRLDRVDESKAPSSVDDSEKSVSKSLSAARDFMKEILLIEDDPTQNPWTFRMWFIGIGMSLFAG